MLPYSLDINLPQFRFMEVYSSEKPQRFKFGSLKILIAKNLLSIKGNTSVRVKRLANIFN